MTAPVLTDIDVAHEMADAARTAILPHFRSRSLIADNKEADGFDPVTEADRAAELAMRAVLARHRPEDGVWGEEFGAQSGPSGRQWVLDPIDGTRAFISGTPTWGVLIALGPEGQAPDLGMVDQPYIGERFWGDSSGAAYVGPKGEEAIATTTTGRLGDATLFTTFPELGTAQERAGFEAVAAHVKLVRYGMDCYAYALLAAGQIDLVIEAGLQAYDIQGPMALIQGAGGVVTTWSGQSAHMGGQVVAAANPEMHRLALDYLSPFAE